jgi:hypothetical protein
MNQDITATRLEGSIFKVEVQSEEPHFYGFFEIDLIENYEKGSEHNSDSYNRHVDWTTFYIPDQIFYDGEKELFEKWVTENKEKLEDKIRQPI